MPDFEERTEEATSRRREKAREEGQVWRSREILSVGVMGGVLSVLYITGSKNFSSFADTFRLFFSLKVVDPYEVVRVSILKTLGILAPFFSVCFIIAIVADISQGGLVMRPLFKLSFINPFNGIKRIFSLDGISDMLKMFLKFLIFSALFYLLIKHHLKDFVDLSNHSISNINFYAFKLIGKTVLFCFLAYVIIGISDLFLQKWHYERSLRMTKQELKEEYKETEGNPQLKARIKSIQRELARRRMLDAVSKATVVITNPTHLAVALSYDSKMPAPKVVAKGADFLAEKIKEVARKNSVPIIEDKPLARALYKLKIDTYIPEELYRAVAQILAFIFKAQKRR